jgi:uridine kinase
MAGTADSLGVVLIDGRSGAGKTDYATALARQIGATLVSLDEVYPGWDGLDAGSWHLHRNVLVPISQGRPARYQRWNWRLSAPADWVDVPANCPVVIEGCGALRREALDLSAERIWVEATAAVRRARALERDREMYAPHWERWALQEERFLALHDGRGMADRIVTTD